MKLIDLHCDTLGLIGLSKTEMSLHKNDLHVDLEKLKKADSMAQFFAIFVHLEHLKTMGNITAYEAFNHFYGVYQRELKLHSDKILPAFSYDDIIANDKNGKLSSVLTIEEGEVVGGSMEKLQDVYEKGVRLITLTWNFENCFGYPNSQDKNIMEKGLKPFGFEAIEMMNNIGMAVDVSHLSDGGFWDVISHSKKPFIASHSNARALKNHSRNLTDDMLKALANKGGVTGINFYHSFLNDDVDTSRIDAIIEHMKHIKNVAGIDVLSIGTDYDGIPSKLEITDIGEISTLLPHMGKAGFSDDEIEKVFYKNALRFIKDTIK